VGVGRLDAVAYRHIVDVGHLGAVVYRHIAGVAVYRRTVDVVHLGAAVYHHIVGVGRLGVAVLCRPDVAAPHSRVCCLGAAWVDLVGCLQQVCFPLEVLHQQLDCLVVAV